MFVILLLSTILSLQAQTPKEESLFLEKDGLKNHYLAYRSGHKKALIILPGMTEPAKKYRELIKDMATIDHDIFVFDHAGQGNSDYLIANLHPHKVFVKDFSSYIGPVRRLLEELKKSYSEVDLLAHSMGAHIGLRVLMEDPAAFNKAALVAPMIEIDLRGFPKFLVEIFLPAIWQPTDWCPSKGPYKQREISKNRVTSSKERSEQFHNLLMSEPKLIRSGCTVGWLMAAIKSNYEVQKFKKWKEYSLPVKMYFADKERFVFNQYAQSICKKLKDCQGEVFKDSKHELLMEKDETREPLLKKVREFLK